MNFNELALEAGNNFTADEKFGILDFHSLRICTSNAKVLSFYFQKSMGFVEIAYRGLETGSYYSSSHVLQNGSCVIELVSLICPSEPFIEQEFSPCNDISIIGVVQNTVKNFAECYKIDLHELTQTILKKYSSINTAKTSILREKLVAKRLSKEKIESIMINNFISNHGDGVMDILLKVDNCNEIYKRSIKFGSAISISPPQLQADEKGSVKMATIGIPGTNIQHTLIENINYSGTYLPFYKSFEHKIYSVPQLEKIDHCVENYTTNQMDIYANFYRRAFNFHKYWSVDEKDVSTTNASLKSIVMASENENVKIPINEPGEGNLRGQIEEFYDYNLGPGIQHVAFKTKDIIKAVREFKKNGIVFNDMKKEYYNNLKSRMQNDDVTIKQSLEELESLNILVDYDAYTKDPVTKECNYILQIFTRPISDRPTLFFELIERHNHNGFGKGTFKGLFESIEAQQKSRGTLIAKRKLR